MEYAADLSHYTENKTHTTEPMKIRMQLESNTPCALTHSLLFMRSLRWRLSSYRNRDTTALYVHCSHRERNSEPFINDDPARVTLWKLLKLRTQTIKQSNIELHVDAEAISCRTPKPTKQKSQNNSVVREPGAHTSDCATHV